MADQVSLDANMCRSTSLQDVLSDIEKLLGQLCEAEIATDSATDLETVQRAINHKRRLRFSLKMLETVRSEKIFASQVTSFSSLVNQAQATTAVKLKQIQHQVNALVKKVEVNHSVQEELQEVKEAVRSSDCLGKKVLQTCQICQEDTRIFKRQLTSLTTVNGLGMQLSMGFLETIPSKKSRNC
jgi:hypothetical protein